jgi:hypothetical protein
MFIKILLALGLALASALSVNTLRSSKILPAGGPVPPPTCPHPPCSPNGQ